MISLAAGDRKSIDLPAGQVLTVASSVASTGAVYRLGDVPGAAQQGLVASLEASETAKLGPFLAPRRYDVACATGALSASFGLEEPTASNNALDTRLTAGEAELADHEDRITALEPPPGP